MTFVYISYILTALHGLFNETGITNNAFLTRTLANDTFDGANSLVELPSRCINFTDQLQADIYKNLDSCVASANATYDIRSGGVLDETLVQNLALVGINGSLSSVELANRIMTDASNSILFFCDVTSCNAVKDKDADDGEKDNDGAGLCAFQTLFPQYTNSTTGFRLQLTNQAKDDCKERICDAVTARISNDPDIGGIGVFISYFQQVAIALVILANIIIHNMFYRQPRRSTSEPESPTRRASFFNPKHWHKSSEEFIAFGFNFQTAQIWFLSTLMIASYIRRATGDVSIVNSYMLLNLALNGVGLLSFTLLLLALLKRDKVDCFVMYSTSLSYFLCFCFMVYIMITTRTETDDWLHASAYCDGTVVPKLVKRRRWEAMMGYITANRGISRGYYVAVMVFCTVVLFFTTSLVRLKFNVTKYYEKNRILTIAVGAFTSIGYVLVFFMQLWLMGLFTRLASVIWTQQWGFGQILAVSVWIPIIADYFWDKFQRKKDYLRHLTPPVWASKLRVVRYLGGTTESTESRRSSSDTKHLEEGRVQEKENVSRNST